MEARWLTRRVARPDLTVRRCWDQWIEERSFTRRPQAQDALDRSVAEEIVTSYSDDNRFRVWRHRGERLNPAFALQRHTAPTADVKQGCLKTISVTLSPSLGLLNPQTCHQSSISGIIWDGKLRVRPQRKSVDFHDAENRQRTCRIIIRHVKDPKRVCLAWVLSAKLNPSAGSHRQSSGASLWGRKLDVKITCGY
ncbi:hypothetical protein TNCV_1782091 [Trichonephila clavipes]|nr:hypothetical protein TNCV_1782091 [Trichonephila clavipes]